MPKLSTKDVVIVAVAILVVVALAVYYLVLLPVKWSGNSLSIRVAYREFSP